MEDLPKKDGKLALGPLDGTLGEMHEHRDHLTNDKSTWQTIAHRAGMFGIRPTHQGRPRIWGIGHYMCKSPGFAWDSH